MCGILIERAKIGNNTDWLRGTQFLIPAVILSNVNVNVGGKNPGETVELLGPARGRDDVIHPIPGLHCLQVDPCVETASTWVVI
jgi:hypothetical protein